MNMRAPAEKIIITIGGPIPPALAVSDCPTCRAGYTHPYCTSHPYPTDCQQNELLQRMVHARQDKGMTTAAAKTAARNLSSGLRYPRFSMYLLTTRSDVFDRSFFKTSAPGRGMSSNP
jgi:hypothetical protein